VWKASLSLIVATVLCGADRYQASEPHMGTLVTITLYADSPDQAQSGFVAAFGRIAKLNSILSDYDSSSELSRYCEISSPSPDLRTVVEYAQRLARQTDGAFDITAGALSRLWRNARKQKRLPTSDEIRQALSKSGYNRLCKVPSMHLDAGGIAKGYAADEALATLRKGGIESALVAVSGDVAASGAPPGQAGWRVRVQNEPILLVNAAVSTSGDEFQFLEIDGVKYSHIFDPRTGMALRDFRTVSVIAPAGMEADSLATAIAVLGSDWVKWIKLGPGVRVIFGRQDSALSPTN
jgi:thiamine biosynthesis lipoprotein